MERERDIGGTRREDGVRHGDAPSGDRTMARLLNLVDETDQLPQVLAVDASASPDGEVTAISAIEAQGGRGAIARASPAWVCRHVKAHLKTTEGLDVD